MVSNGRGCARKGAFERLQGEAYSAEQASSTASVARRDVRGDPALRVDDAFGGELGIHAGDGCVVTPKALQATLGVAGLAEGLAGAEAIVRELHQTVAGGVLASAASDAPLSGEEQEAADGRAKGARRSRYRSFAEPLKRAFDLDVRCENCNARMQLKSLLMGGKSLEQLLVALGEPPQVRERAPPRGGADRRPIFDHYLRRLEKFAGICDVDTQHIARISPLFTPADI